MRLVSKLLAVYDLNDKWRMAEVQVLTTHLLREQEDNKLLEEILDVCAEGMRAGEAEAKLK